MKLIDKDALLAEIERKQKEEVSYYENGSFASWSDENHYFTLEDIKSFIDTLEVKDVDLKNSMVCKVDWYDGFLLDYTQEQYFSYNATFSISLTPINVLLHVLVTLFLLT